MPIVRSESRCRIGIVWYDNEAEAKTAGDAARLDPGAEAVNIGYVQVGRDKAFDRPGEYAVVIP
jgi:hypothetical protein